MAIKIGQFYILNRLYIYIYIAHKIRLIIILLIMNKYYILLNKDRQKCQLGYN